MKTIVAGSRNCLAKSFIYSILDKHMDSISEVVSGLAKGPDTIGKEWAEENNIPVKEFPADWNTLGRRAGFVRNCAMGDYAECLLAFWDGKSRGTKQMIDYANEKGLLVKIYYSGET